MLPSVLWQTWAAQFTIASTLDKLILTPFTANHVAEILDFTLAKIAFGQLWLALNKSNTSCKWLKWPSRVALYTKMWSKKTNTNYLMNGPKIWCIKAWKVAGELVSPNGITLIPRGCGGFWKLFWTHPPPSFEFGGTQIASPISNRIEHLVIHLANLLSLGLDTCFLLWSHLACDNQRIFSSSSPSFSPTRQVKQKDRHS